MEDCDLGYFEFRYRFDHPFLPATAKHYVEVDDVIGIFDLATPTLITNAGGMALDRNSLVRHYPTTCTNQRARA